MPARDIVVIGASAGGLDAVVNVVRSLPANLPATIFIVIHTSPEGPGLLPDILGRIGTLPVRSARNGDPIVHGQIFVAPPDYHLFVTSGYVGLSRGPREHRFRPAIDPLFRSAAEHYGARTIGVVLSGSMGDGTHGLMLIKSRGGAAIVQDPKEALFPGMPLNAIDRVKVDYVLPSEQIGAVITELTMARTSRPRPRSKAKNARSGADGPTPENPTVDALRSGGLEGRPSVFTCPDCGGALWDIKEGKLVRYRCHVGHGYSEESLATAQDSKLEETLWSALRALEELIALRRRMVASGRVGNLTSIMPGVSRDLHDLEQRADALRGLLLADPAASGATQNGATSRAKRSSRG
jgi:two-component system, chemotaxis family, protein-glutamate methylesterase/glutaminase